MEKMELCPEEGESEVGFVNLYLSFVGLDYDKLTTKFWCLRIWILLGWTVIRKGRRGEGVCGECTSE